MERSPEPWTCSLDLSMFLLQEAQEMQLLKFKSELSPPAVPSTELAQLIKVSLHHPESYTHPFTQDRWDTLLHGGDVDMDGEEHEAVGV